MSRNLPKQLQKGLVMWLDGNGKDLSGNGNHGVLINSPTKVRRLQNDGLSYNGSNQALTVPYTGFNGLAGITISFWIEAVDVSGFKMLMIYRQSSSTRYPYVALNGDKINFLMFNNVGGNGQIASIDGLSANKKYLVTCTYDSSTLRIYHNGVQNNSGTPLSGAIGTDATPTFQFATNNSTQWFGGDIINPMIWNRALSQKEIEMLRISTFIK